MKYINILEEKSFKTRFRAKTKKAAKILIRIMKNANKISIRVFCTPEENKELIKDSFHELIGFSEDNLAEEKISWREQNAKGFNDRNIIVFSAELEKDRHCNYFLERLKNNLNLEDKKRLLEEDNRLDENMNFYVRLDKPSLSEKEYKVTDSGDCYHIRISIAAFPKKKEIAKKKISEILGT